MDSDLRTRTGASSPGQGMRPLGAVPAAVDEPSATRLASSLRRRPGHVVVTAPFATTGSRLFELAEPQLGAARVVRVSARVLLEPEILRALAGTHGRGREVPSPASVASVVEDARARNRSIVLLVEDADALDATRLEQARAVVERTQPLRDVVRIALVGSGRLLRMLEAPEAVAFGRRVTLHLNVSAPGIPRRREATTAEPTRRARPRRSDQWLSNEQLLVLAVGAALVTGVLLFPVEPTEYPAPAPPDAVPASAPPDAVAAAAPPEAVAPSAPPDAVVPSAPAARDAAPPAPVSAPVAPVVEERAVAVSEPEAVEPPSPHRFSPPARPGPAFQVGAFRKLENATRLAERLDRDFDGVYIHQLGAGPTSLYRVRVSIPGLLAESALARELRARDYAIVRIE